MNRAMGILAICLLMILATLFPACEDSIVYGSGNRNSAPVDSMPGDTIPPPQPQGILDTLTLYLAFDYWNPSGIDPHIKIDTDATSDLIKVGENILRKPPIVGQPNVTFLLEDIKVDYSPVYSRIFKWWSEELLSDHWHNTSEFAVSKRDKTRMNIVLVLDVSNSLGGDFYWVKEYAKDFLDIIYTEMRDNIRYPKIAIVDFSTLINYIPLTTKQSDLIDHINGLQQGQYTALYAAMNTGIDLLAQESDTLHHRAMVTFTDGNDNYSGPVTKDFLLNKITDPVFNTPKIRSFVLGFKGRDGLDESILESLAVNNGEARFTSSIFQLKVMFENIAKDITRSVNFTYTRNDQIIPESEKRRVRIGISLERHIIL